MFIVRGGGGGGGLGDDADLLHQQRDYWGDISVTQAALKRSCELQLTH